MLRARVLQAGWSLTLLGRRRGSFTPTSASTGSLDGHNPGMNSGMPAVREMHLMRASTGWALAGQEIFSTDTGGRGQSWSNIAPPIEGTQRIDGAYFLDADHGWALLHTWQTMTGLSDISIALTTDGGKQRLF
jgi:hypothetical protein